MFQATCNKCGNSCEVPFRPTGEKPVFCKNCFAGGGGRGEQVPQPPHAHAPADQYKEQFKALNTKLDAILEALKKTNIAPTKAAEPQAKTEAAPPKKTEEKKVVAKKKKAVTKKK
ncbi:hypothetical protein KBD18_00915 [Patescibacteria group bacterium]|nr:hypothetical protein [Patescibacteria group bacterium]